MPVFSLTSPKTGKSYKLDINGTPEPDEWDHIGEQLDAQEAQRAGVDPAVLEQGPVGTFVNTVRNIGPEFLAGPVAGLARLNETLGRSPLAALSPLGLANQATAMMTGINPLGSVERAAEVIQQEGQDMRPTNPFNPTAQTVGQAVNQIGGMIASGGTAALAGMPARTAAMVVPQVYGLAAGAGQGIDTAREMGITDPTAQAGMGLAFGGVEALTEKIGGIGGDAVNKFINPTSLLGRGALNTISESGEEILAGRAQDAITVGAGQFVSDPNRPGFTRSGFQLPSLNPLNPDTLARMKQEAIGGAAGGVIFSGLQALSPALREGVGQTMSDPTAPDVPESTGELTAAEVADIEAGQPMSQNGQPVSGDLSASVTKDSGPTADQTVQQAPGAGLSPAAGALTPEPTGSATRNDEARMANAEAGPGAPAQIVASPKPNGAAVETETQFVEASDLEPLLQIEVNADQTRDRAGNRGSAEQIASIAVNPDSRLLSDSPVSSIGAPVVDDVVLAGNGRAAGILKGYSDNTPGMARYRADVVRMAAARGQDISGMRQPVMIRKVKRYVSGDRRTFVVESNPKYAALQETTAEAALLDAEALGDVSGLEFTEQGMLTSSSAQQVAIRLKNAQRGVNATTGGKPDVVEATRRVQLAGLARLARDNGVDVSDLSAFLETDTGRRVLAEFTRAAPQLAALDADLGLGDVLLPALKVFNQGAIAVAQRKFSGIGEWAANRRNELIQDDLSLESSTLLDFMVASTRKPTILRQLFESYLEAAANEQDQRNLSRGSADIFGGQRAGQPGRDILARQMAGQADATAANLQSPGGQTAGLDAPLMNPARDFTGALAGSLQQAARQVSSSKSQVSSSGPPETLNLKPETLNSAYAVASQGRSTVMVELGDVWAAAKAAQPDLQPGDFIADVMRQYEAGTVLLEGANSRQEADAAGLRIDGTPVGTAVRMAMVATNAEGGRRNAESQPLQNPASVTPAQDAAYLAAVQAGDLATAQRIVDEAAEKAGGEIHYRAGSPYLNDDGFLFLAEDKDYASNFGDSVDRYYAFPKNTLNLTQWKASKWVTHEEFIEVLKENGIDTSKLERNSGEPLQQISQRREPKGTLAEAITDAGFDSIRINEYVEGGGKNVSLAMLDDSLVEEATNPVTRDDSGNVIPLSQRFQTTSPDIRYSPAELAATERANIAALKALGLPTKKGTRVWGGKLIKNALARIAKDATQPQIMRTMAGLLAKMDLGNLLLRIESDARLRYAGMYQPMAGSRGEIALNTRAMGRGVESGQGDIVMSLVHEALHHATYRNLRNPKNAIQKQAKADLEALRKRARAALAANEELSQFDYELSNEDEFISGLFTRPDFQAALAAIPAELAPKTLTQRVRSMLDEIFRTLAELVVGRKVEPGSVLDAAFSASLRLMEDGGPSVQAASTPADSAGIGQDSAAGLFRYAPRDESTLDAGERAALNAVRDAYPGERVQPLRLQDLQPSPDGPRRGQMRRDSLREWSGIFGRLFGKRILFIDGPARLNGASASGQRNVIVVNANSREPLLYVLGHELTHALKAQRPQLYQELEREILRSGENLEKYRDKLRKLKYAEKELNNELVADFIGSQMLEPKFLNQLAATKPPLFERFAQAVVKFLDSLLSKVSKLNRDVRPYFEQKIQPLREQLAAVLKDYAATGVFPDNPLDDSGDVNLSRKGLMNPATDPNLTRSRFAPPREADQVINAREDAQVALEAGRWLASVDQQTAIEQFVANAVPLPLDAQQHAAGLLIAQLSAQYDQSSSEVERMWNHVQMQRMARVWKSEFLSADPARSQRQRAVVNNTILQPISAVLAAQEVLIDRGTRVTKARFEGGGEGVVTRLLDLLKKAEAQAGEQIAKAAADIATPAPVVDPVIAAADVQAVTEAAADYFGGKLPARVKVLHAAGATWDARLNGEVLELNAAALEASQVRDKIEHEIGHLLFRDPGLRKSFETIWASLSAMERAQIENITAALYDANNRNEEASVRALDRVRQMVEARQPSLWQRFVEWVKRAWEKFTGRPPRDPRRLAAQMMETGIARLRGERGASTEVRESKRGDLLAENSPALVRALNDLRKKMLPGMTWEEIFTDLPSTQKARQRAIYERLKKDQRLQALTPEERLKLTNELDKAWQRERRKVFRRELDKAGVLGEKAPSDRQKVKNAMPKLLRLINLGMFNSEMFREAIAPEYGLRVIDAATAAKLRHLAEAAYSMPEGVMRYRKLRELLHAMQAATGSSIAEIVNSYWTASVLSGLRTQFDTWLAFVNGMGTNLIQAGALLARGQGRNAIGAHAAWWRGLRESVREALQILVRGDYSVLKNFGRDLNETLKGEKQWRPVPLGESLWQNGNVWQKYAMAPVMIWTGRLMAAADHINNTATTAGAMAVARAMHPEIYNGRGDFTPQERADARAQALREITGGNPPADKAQRVLVDVRTREILYATVSEDLRQAASDIGDTAAYQNDPTGLFGSLYGGIKGWLSSTQRVLDEKAQDMEADRMTRALAAVLSGSLYGVTGTRFIRFGFNFGADLTRYIPGTALFKDLYGGAKMSRMEQDLLIGKNVIGLMITSTLAALFLTGDDEDEGWQIEGDWSNLTPQEQKARMAAGIERMTMWKREDGKVRRVSYKQWPTMALFAAVGGMLDEKRHRPDVWAQRGVPGHLLRGALTGVYQVKNVTAMRGLMELFGESSFGTDKSGAWGDALIRAGSNFVGGAVPTLVKDAEVWNDPRSFKPEGVLESVMRGMPIARKFVNDGRPQLNLLGEEVKLQRAPWSRAYTSVASAEAHRVLGALMARGLSLPQPSDQIAVYQGGVKMSLEKLGREAVWRYEKAVGEGYRAWLAEDGNRLLAMPVAAADKVIAARANAIKQQALARVTGR